MLMNSLFRLDFVTLVCCICDNTIQQFTISNQCTCFICFSAASVVILTFSYCCGFQMDIIDWTFSTWYEFIL